MEKTLVIGATGNVGLETVKALQKLGQNPIAAVRNPAKAQTIFEAEAECRKFDFRQPETFKAAFAGISQLFLVRPPDISNAEKDIKPAIEAAQSAGVRYIVFLSIVGAANNRFVPHHKVEQLIEASGLAWTFLRAGFFMQNLNTTHLDDIRLRNEIFLPAGTGKTSFIDVRDIAEVAALTLTERGHEGQAYDLTGSETLDYYEVATRFTEILGRPIVYSNPSPLRFGLEMRKRGLATAFILVMIGIYTTTRFGLAAKISPETARLLGHKPHTVRQYIEDYKNVWL